MRIAIVNLTGGGISGGYRKYLQNIIPLLSSHKDVKAILCAAPKKISFNSWFKTALKNVSFIGCKPFSIIGRIDIQLHHALAAFNPDVIYIPLERYFSYGNTPVVCMLQNMLPLVGLQYVPLLEVLRNRVQKIVACRSVKKADRIIAISSFVSEFMHNEWNVELDKIGVVYHGVTVPAEDFSVVPATVPVEWIENFIFTAGAIESYRGLEDLFQSLRCLRQDGYAIKVVVAGAVRPVMKSYFKKLQRLVEQLDLQESICWAGTLNEKEMAWCYKNACAFIMSSKVEACPNTALEAMSYGNIIISSTAPPMPEFFGESAIYYEVGDVQKLAACIKDAFGLSTAQRDNLSRTAIKRAGEFSWEHTVNETVEQLKKAVSDKLK
jgi:glycosyltransferase involved in cell wall biosynthesis